MLINRLFYSKLNQKFTNICKHQSLNIGLSSGNACDHHTLISNSITDPIYPTSPGGSTHATSPAHFLQECCLIRWVTQALCIYLWYKQASAFFHRIWHHVKQRYCGSIPVQFHVLHKHCLTHYVQHFLLETVQKHTRWYRHGQIYLHSFMDKLFLWGCNK